MLLYKNDSDCSACTACMNICPKNAIEMKANIKGFNYPYIDETLCINCGLCLEICDFQKNDEQENNIQKVFGLRHKNKSVLMQSTSGGAFTLLSDYILNNHGYVCGALFDDEFNLYHLVTNDPKKRDEMRGSKYVQSSLGNCFSIIKRLLIKEKSVLFIGTPCQCAGLKSFLGKYADSKSLFIIDFLCHGVPSNKILKEYINFLEKKYSQKIVKYTFREKRYGWGHNEDFLFENGVISSLLFISSFKNLFYRNIGLRESCYKCKYACMHRYSDITIADFWGCEKELNIKDLDGLSLVLINSNKGTDLFMKVKDDCIIYNSDIDKINQTALKHPSKCNLDINKFWNDYLIHGFEYIIQKYGRTKKKVFFKTVIFRVFYNMGLGNTFNSLKLYIHNRINRIKKYD